MREREADRQRKRGREREREREKSMEEKVRREDNLKEGEDGRRKNNEL